MKSAPPIPSALKEKLTAIDNEVVLLHFKWTHLMQLFGTEKHLAVINATAPSIFSVIEEAMLTDILLKVTKSGKPVITKSRGRHFRPEVEGPSYPLGIPDKSENAGY